MEPENDGVVFESKSSLFNAASLQQVTFTFAAATTPIRGGRVNFSIPGAWDKGEKSEDDVLGQVTVSGGPSHDDDLTVSSSGRSITVDIDSLDIDEAVTITYGGKTKKAMVGKTAGLVKINGYYWVSANSPRRGAGTVEIELTNVADGAGTATIRANNSSATPEVKAGSIDNTVTVEYSAAGTMDGGAISLEQPEGWGDFQTDPSQLNYISVSASGRATIEEIDNGGSIIIVTLDKCPPNGKVKFTYGGGSGARQGARAQDNIAVATFMIKAQGDAFGSLQPIAGEDELDDDEKVNNPDGLGQVFTGDANIGKLRVGVIGASDGNGTAEVMLVESKAGDAEYADADEDEMRVHAADDATYIKIVYTPTEAVEDGALRFTAPDGWSKPQGSDPGLPGFTRVQSTGSAVIDATEFGDPEDLSDLSLTVPISSADRDDTIEIHYGETAAEWRRCCGARLQVVRTVLQLILRAAMAIRMSSMPLGVQLMVTPLR